MSGVTVTPSGVREGDPAALAALCAVRGPSVVAYCRHVAGEADAGAAAADAFARFRVAVVAAGDTSTLNPEALLIKATRTSAAAHVVSTAQGDCADVPALLATRADKSISVADLERLEAHLEHCWACRAPVARFKAAERAYRDPPEKTIEPELATRIVEALVAAVPPPAPPEPAAVSANGVGPDAADAPAADPPATQAVGVEQATENFMAPGMIEAPAEPDPDADAAAAATARRERRAKRRSGAGAGAAGLLARLRPAASEDRAPRERARARGPRMPAASPAAIPATPRELAAPRERREPARPGGRRMGLVLPIVLILLALLGALFVSGVFGGDDPASSSGVSVPAAAPDDTTQPELVVVPGAKDASADAVETAKARERARERGGSTSDAKKTEKSDAARQASAPAATPPPPPAASPPAAPAVSANNPVRKPASKPATSAGDQTQIDAGSGATGAEQIPPAADASDVPDLAPPPETATP